jgi:MFS family permease
MAPHDRPPAGRLVHYLTGAVLVRLADEGARVALVLLALRRTDSAAIGGLLVAALLIPHVVAAPVVGMLADRSRRPQRIIAAAALGFAAALGGTAVLLGRMPLPIVVAVLLAGGCCGPALTGGLTSQLSGVVTAPALPRAFGLDSLFYNVSGIVGPAGAAVLSSAFSPGLATGVLAASAGTGAVVLATLPLSSAAHGARAEQSARLTSGVRAIAQDRALGVVTACSSLGQLGPGALPVVAAVLATREHTPAASGILMTAVAAGGLLGSLAWTWRPAAVRRAPLVVMLTLIGTGVPLAVSALSPTLPPTVALFALSGFFTGPFAGALFTVRQDRAPAAVRAQIFTLGAGLKTTAAAAGAAVAGVISTGPTVIQLLVAGACPLVAGAAGTALLDRSPRDRGQTSPC